MNKGQLIEIIEELEVDEEVKIKSSSFVFGLKKVFELDTETILFGGYGNHLSVFSISVFNEFDETEQIANGIIEHLKGYHSNVTEWITLEECGVV